MSDEVRLDESALARLQRLGGEGFVRQMLELFVAYAPKRLSAAREGQQAGNLVAIANAVHPLKSSSGQIGATRVAKLAAEVESFAEGGDAAGASQRLADLETEVEQISTLVNAKLKELIP